MNIYFKIIASFFKDGEQRHFYSSVGVKDTVVENKTSQHCFRLLIKSNFVVTI